MCIRDRLEGDFTVVNVTKTYWWCDTCNYTGEMGNALKAAAIAAGGTYLTLVYNPTYSGYTLTTDATETMTFAMGSNTVQWRPQIDQVVVRNAGSPYYYFNGVYHGVGQDKPTVYLTYKNYS